MDSGQKKLGLLGIAALSVLLLVTTGLILIAWLATDQERMRALVENVVSDATNRPFRIEGPFKISYGRMIRISAADVRWADADWGDSDDIMDIGGIELTIDPYGLLGRNVIIKSAAARDARLTFEWDADEQFNWDFYPDDEPAQQPPGPLPLFLSAARLDNIELQFIHPTLTDTLTLQINQASHTADDRDRLVLDADLKLKDRPIKLTGAIGPFPQLAVAGAVDFDLQLSGPLASFSTVGDIDWLAKLSNPNLVLNLQAESTSALLDSLQLPDITNGPTELRFAIDREDERIRAFAQGQLGDFNVSGELQVDSVTSFDGFRLVADADGPSISKILSLAGINALTDHPFELHVLGNETSDGIELQRIEFETRALRLNANGRLRQTDDARDITLQLDAAGSDIRDVAEIFDLETGNAVAYELQATISGNGIGTPDSLKATGSLGRISGSIDGTLSEQPDFAGSVLNYDLEAPDLRPLTRLFGLELTDQVPATLSGTANIDAGAIRVANVNARLADNELAGSGVLYAGDGPERFDLQATWSGADLAATAQRAEFTAALPLPAVPFSTSGRLQLRGNTLQIDATDSQIGGSSTRFDGSIDFAGEVPQINAVVSADGDNLAELLSGTDLLVAPARPFSASAQLQTSADAIRVTGFTAELAKGTLKGDFAATGEDYSRLEFDMAAIGPDLSTLVPADSFWEPAAVPFELDVRGVLADDMIDLDEGTARLGDARFTATGEIDFAPQFAVRALQVDASGQRLNELGNFGDWVLSDEPFNLTAKLTGAGRGGRADGITLRIGDSEVTGTVSVDTAERTFVDIDLLSSEINLDRIRSPAAVAGTTTTDYFSEDAEPVVARSGSYFSDEPFSFEFLDSIDADLDVRFDTLITRGRRLANVRVFADLADGSLNLEELSFKSGEGLVSAYGNWRPGDNGKQFDLRLLAENIAFEPESISQEDAELLPRFSVDAMLTAAGDSPADLAASANGYFWALGGEGRIRRLQLSALWGDFATQLLNTLNPFAQERVYSSIDCQGYYLDITNGLLNTSPVVVVQTQQVVVVAQGEANLQTGRLDFNFETTPRRGIGISVNDLVSPFTRVGGTFDSPRIAIDARSSAVSGSAAVITGGLSIIGTSLWRRWVSTRQVCERTGQRAVTERSRRDPDNVPDFEKMRSSLQPPAEP